jgi:hypothetical protein
MILANIIKEEANTKLMQQKVSHDLQKKTETKGKKAVATAPQV